jgi:hypothetical protein
VLQQGRFRKSSHSHHDACVEVAVLPSGTIAVRDSKDKARHVQLYSRLEWQAFVAGVKDGEFDYPIDL